MVRNGVLKCKSTSCNGWMVYRKLAFRRTRCQRRSSLNWWSRRICQPKLKNVNLFLLKWTGSLLLGSHDITISSPSACSTAHFFVRDDVSTRIVLVLVSSKWTKWDQPDFKMKSADFILFISTWRRPGQSWSKRRLWQKSVLVLRERKWWCQSFKEKYHFWEHV